MKYTKHILIIRLSAIGDVAMAAPVVRQAAEAFPDIKFTMVSRPLLQPLFEGISNLQFVGVVTDDYRGLKGIWRLFRFLRMQQPDCVADIHDVLRTKGVKLFFRLSGTKVYVIDKGRKEKRQLTRRNNKMLRPLKPTIERYRDVLEQCVCNKIATDKQPFVPQYESPISIKAPVVIGIAPFAAHVGKIYPIEKMEEVAAHFARTKGIPVFLFGGGNAEQQLLDAWAARYPNMQSVAGKLKLKEELGLMQRLSVMITMDSANMHLASFVGTPVVSVWGATHPDAGFYGWKQPLDNIVSTTISCRPCSIYGNKPCFRHDYYCLNTITPDNIIEKVLRKCAI